MDVLRLTDNALFTKNFDRVIVVVLVVFNDTICTYSNSIMAHQYRVFGVNWLSTKDVFVPMICGEIMVLDLETFHRLVWIVQGVHLDR